MDGTNRDDLSVGDPVLHKTRLLSRQCGTCIFRPGNPMHLAPGQLASLVNEARGSAGYIICHDTLPYGDHPDAPPAVCRGFHDRYDTPTLRLMRHLWGFVEVDPPGTTPEEQGQAVPSSGEGDNFTLGPAAPGPA